MKIITILVFALSISISSQEIVDDAIDFQVDASSLSVTAQKQVEDLDEVSKQLYFEYKDTINEYNALKNYDDQLSKIIDSQFVEIKRINEELDSIDIINIDILPLLNRMINSLRKFVELDLPFLFEERMKKVNDLDELMLRSDVTTAEKFRNVFEAYQQESEFGKTIENYPGYLLIDGEELAVDFFRLGRLGLFYRTPDGADTGYWDQRIESWKHLGNDLDQSIKDALNISNRQAPPNFINLPLKPITKNES
tara:strand:+ start:89 stop:844 length:756 start_codon:yes stop_codon:yes gene_type:complete